MSSENYDTSITLSNAIFTYFDKGTQEYNLISKEVRKFSDKGNVYYAHLHMCRK